MAVLGEISIGGTLIKVEELASTLQVCLDSGAKKVLLPITSAADLGTVPSDLVGAFSLIFYSSPEEAVYKALGVTEVVFLYDKDEQLNNVGLSICLGALIWLRR